jgi:hypothetical protein
MNKIEVQKNTVTTLQLDGTISIVYTDEGVVVYHGTCFINQTPKPLFKHDCEKCLFLGVFNEDHDGYYCPTEETCIARYGDKPEQYLSMPIKCIPDEDMLLSAVKKSVEELGLL